MRNVGAIFGILLGMTFRRRCLRLAPLPLALAALSHCSSGGSEPTRTHSQQAGLSTPSAAVADTIRAHARLATKASGSAIYRVDSKTGAGKNPAQRFRFEARGLNVRLNADRKGSWLEVGPLVASRGHKPTTAGGWRRELGAKNELVFEQAAGMRVVYRNGPLGLEQTIDVKHRPAGKGLLELRFPLSHSEGAAKGYWRVEELLVEDARGKLVPARLNVSDSALVITIDDSQAAYPLRVDPTIATPKGFLSGEGALGYGRAVALAKGAIVVGAPGVGHARMAIRDMNGWMLGDTLTPSGGDTPGFGASVAMETGWVGVSGSGQDQVLMFKDTAGSYTLSGSPVTGNDSQAGDGFGTTLAMANGVMVVGAPTKGNGAAYVFERSGDSWSQTGKLTFASLTANAKFGASLATDGTSILVGAPEHGSGNSQQGLVVAFRKVGQGWPMGTAVNPPMGASGGRFGQAVAVSGNAALVGEPGAKKAHFFQSSGGSWSLNETVQTPPMLGDGGYGSSVAIEGNRALVGAPTATGVGATPGAAYLYFQDKGKWFYQSPLVSGVAIPGTFGNALALAGDEGVVGAFDTLAKPGLAFPYDFEEKQEAAGGPCTNGFDCTTGFCADGVCCDAACDGECQSCLAKDTGAKDGECKAVSPKTDPANECGTCRYCDGKGACRAAVIGTDPKDECAPANAPCGPDGVCDGSGACRAQAPNGTPCGTTTCDMGNVSGQICNGMGSCGNGMAACGAYVCQGDMKACATECAGDPDCAAGSYCNEDKRCTTSLADGQACTRDRECSNNHCVDGFCCNAACGEQCAACDVAGSEGSCSPVTGAPRGDRDPCTGTGETCGGSCDGSNTAACAYPSESTTCGDGACTNGDETAPVCNGSGNCVQRTVKSCFPHKCGATTCETSCTADTDCAADARCLSDSGTCVPNAGFCQGDATFVDAQGNAQSCGAYKCKDFKCLTSCRADDDCSGGSCKGGVCGAAPAPPADDSGCGCQIPQQSGSSGGLALGGLALAAFLLSRRRSSSTRRALAEYGRAPSER